MGRKSLAEKIFDEIEEDPDEPYTWLVVYDFTESKPSTRFWDNLQRVTYLAGEGSLVQYSVFMTPSRRGAITALRLVEHYKGDVMLFRGEEIETR